PRPEARATNRGATSSIARLSTVGTCRCRSASGSKRGLKWSSALTRSMRSTTRSSTPSTRPSMALWARRLRPTSLRRRLTRPASARSRRGAPPATSNTRPASRSYPPIQQPPGRKLSVEASGLSFNCVIKMMTNFRHYVLGAVLALSFCSESNAQGTPQRTPTPNDTLVSTEVLSDRRVTFRIYAPKASEVTLRGDWMETPAPVKLEKDEKGVWAATVGSLASDFYSYSFTVDGVRTLDPKNPTIKQGINSVNNMFFLAGAEAAFQDNKPVPHGEIRKVWYQSTTLGTQRRMHIYFPPGYDNGKELYPVFYLLHGGGDEDSGWSTIGRAGFIIDNLLAEKKAQPMIIVMPNGSLPRPANLPPAQTGAPPDPAVTNALQELFTNELLKD